LVTGDAVGLEVIKVNGDTVGLEVSGEAVGLELTGDSVGLQDGDLDGDLITRATSTFG